MKNTLKFLVALATFATLTACSPRIDYRGKAPETKDLAKIKVGVYTQNNVLQAIGSPTFESSYGPKTWFYVHKKTSTKAFLTPDILEKNTISITFNDKGIVQRIEDMDPNERDINPLSYATPTVGQDRTMLQQVFSNFGKVAKKSEAK